MNGAGGRMLLVLLAAGPGTLPAERAAADPAALEQAARLYDAGDAAGAAEIWERLLRDEDADLDRAAVETSLRDDLPQFLRLSRERAERAARAAADPSIPF